MSTTTKLDLLVSVILPLHEDAPILSAVVQETSDVLSHYYTHHEIILVASDSDPLTMRVAQNLLSVVGNVRIIQLSRDFGREAATIAGLETSIGDFVVTLVPETDSPGLIPAMVQQCREADGMVNGVDDRGMGGGPIRLALKRLFHWYMESALKAKLVPASTDFRVLSRRMVNALTQLSESSRQLRILSSTVGYQRRSFPYTLLARTGLGGRKNFFAELNMGLELLTTHSRQPLRWLSWLAMAASILNLVLCCYTGGHLFFLMFFLLFLILAVLIAYVGRILEQTRGRPLYFIGDEKNSSVLNLSTEERNIVHESN